MLTEFSLRLIFFSLVIIAVALEVIGDVLFKKWSIEAQNLLLIIGLLVYFIGAVFWAVSLKYELLSRAISIFTILNLIIIVLVGVFMFKEELSLINQVGIFLGVASIILIEM